MALSAGLEPSTSKPRRPRILRPGTWSLTSRIVVLCVVIGVGSIGLVSSLIHSQLNETLQTAAIVNVEGILQNRKGTVETHLIKASRGQLEITSQNLMVVDAAVKFTEAWAALPSEVPDLMGTMGDAVENYYSSEFRPRLEEAGGEWLGSARLIPSDPTGQILQGLYIAANPQAVGSKQRLNASSQGTSYDAAHALYHPWFTGLLETNEYYDIFMLDLEGNLIYSVFKEVDYATNLLRGPYRNTGFAKAYSGALSSTVPGDVTTVDMSPYLPSYGAPASFMATPIFDGAKKVGVLAFQLPINKVDALVEDRSGLGEHGEIYIVGADNFARSALFNQAEGADSIKVALTRQSERDTERGERKESKNKGGRENDAGEIRSNDEEEAAAAAAAAAAAITTNNKRQQQQRQQQ